MEKFVYNNLAFVRSGPWQKWINEQEITLGQPYIKEDRNTKTLSLEDRIRNNRITLAQTGVPKWNADLKRFYLPKSLNQVLDFLGAIDAVTTLSLSLRDSRYIIIVNGIHTAKEDDWLSACADMMTELTLKGVLK